MAKAATAAIMAIAEAKEGCEDVFDFAVLSDCVKTRSDRESVADVTVFRWEAADVSQEAVTL